MKRGLLKNFIALLIIFGTISACNLSYFEEAEFGDFVWDPSLAVPVGEITYSIGELFDELDDAGAQIGTNDENVITISYSENLQSQSASTFLAVLDQSFADGLEAGVDIGNPGVSSTITVASTFEFDLRQRGNEAYDSILFSGGNFDVMVSSELDAEINFSMQIRSLLDKVTGNPVTITGTLSPAGMSITSNLNLGDLKGDFTKDASGNPLRNRVVIDFEYVISVEPTSTVSSTDKISFDIGLTDAAFQTIYGDIGTFALDVNFEVANLDFFKDFDAGGIRFSEPALNFSFGNGFGLPLGVDFKDITAIGSQGEIVPLTGSATDSPFIVNAPLAADIGSIVTSDFSINATNSNIADLLEVQPRKVILEVNTASNPPTGPDQYNFVDAGSLLDISVEIELPVIANINNLVARETIPFTNGSDLDQAKKILLRIITENELPLGGNIELEFQDASNNVVFTVSERPVFEAAALGAADRTTGAATTSVDVEFTDADIRAIEGATKIRVLVRLSTTDAASGNAVKFFSDYELKIKLAVQADVEL